MLRQDWSVVLPTDWAIVVYSAVGPILLGFVLWAWALQRRGMGRTAPFGYLEPIFATLLAFVVLGEWFTTWQLVGGALVLAGVVLAAGAKAEPEVPAPL
jgi:DME family drug/metabolite transporter